MSTSTEVTGVDLTIDASPAMITLHRPEVRNALDLAAARALLAAVEKIEADPRVRVAIITGSGPAFCAGADLRARQRGEGRAVIEPYGFGGFVRTPRRKPFITAVNGYAVGGGLEIACACDVIIASPNAHFSLPEVKRGLIGAGDCLPSLIAALPPKLATDMAISGRQMTAVEAARWGLINEVADDALTRATEYARTLLDSAPLALAATKQLLASLKPTPPAGYYAFADALQRELLASADASRRARRLSRSVTRCGPGPDGAATPVNPADTRLEPYAVARRGSGSAPRRALRSRFSPDEIEEALREWARRYGEPPRLIDLDPSRARRMGQEWRADRFEAGHWPTAKMVCSRLLLVSLGPPKAASRSTINVCFSTRPTPAD
jgi:enoyl-CoA hydratase